MIYMMIDGQKDGFLMMEVLRAPLSARAARVSASLSSVSVQTDDNRNIA